LPVDELAVNLAAGAVYDGYFKVVIVAQAAVADVLRKFFAMHDRFGVGPELDAGPIP
jgi:hypothetical protein